MKNSLPYSMSLKVIAWKEMQSISTETKSLLFVIYDELLGSGRGVLCYIDAFTLPLGEEETWSKEPKEEWTSIHLLLTLPYYVRSCLA